MRWSTLCATPRPTTVAVITPPEPIVSLAEAKAHLRVDFDEDDDLIAAMVSAATAALDGPTGWLGRALGPQQLEMSVHSPSENWIDLQYPPIQSIDAVTYDDSVGAEQTVSASAYALRRGGIRLLTGYWPTADDGIRIRYTAGYSFSDSPAVNTVPPNVLAAIKIMVGGMYAFREETIAGVYSPVPDVNSVKNLVGALRIWPI